MASEFNASLHMLQKGGWFAWVTGAEDALVLVYGKQAGILKSGVKYAPPAITAAMYTPVVAVGEAPLTAAMIAALRAEMYKDNLKKINLLKEKDPMVFAAIWAMMFEQCKNILSGHADYAAARTEQDPILLVTIMKSLLEKGEGSDHQKREAKLAMQATFVKFVQGPDMTTAAFKTRYKQMRESLAGLGDAGPDAAEDAEIFLRKLDPSRFSDMNTALDNNAVLGVAKPATVEKAYAVASTWKTTLPQRDNRRGRDDVHSVMAVLTDEVRQHKKPNLGRDQEHGSADRDGSRGGGRDGGRNGGRVAGRGGGRGGGRGTGRDGVRGSGRDGGRGSGLDESRGGSRTIAGRVGGRSVGRGGRVSDNRICWRCNQPGHLSRDCTVPDQNVMVATVDDEADDETPQDWHHAYFGGVPTKTVHRSAHQGLLLLDSQGGVCVTSDLTLVHDVRETNRPYNLGGINSGDRPIRVTQVGTYHNLERMRGRVGVHANISANIISFAELREFGYGIEYNYGADVFTVEGDTHRMEFVRRETDGVLSKHYSHQPLHISHPDAPLPDHSTLTDLRVLINTVSQNRSKYTKREGRQADAAQDFMERLGHASKKDTLAILNGGPLNVTVVPQDVIRSFDIHGGSIPHLKGHTRKGTSLMRNKELSARLVQQQQTLAVDLMFVSKVPFIVGVFIPLNMYVVGYLKSRSAAEIKTHLEKFIAKAKRRDFDVQVIAADGEGGIKKLATGLEVGGIAVDTSGPGQHVEEIENAIKTIKCRVRRIRNTLPYVLSLTLLVLCVMFCVQSLNHVPRETSGSPISPQQKYSGLKLDMVRDLRYPFGAYVQATVPMTDNTTNPRTQGCIAGASTGNTSGSSFMYCLGTRKVVTRDQFTALPMPDEVIRTLNAIAAKEGFRRRADHKGGDSDDGADYSSESDDSDNDSGEEEDTIPTATFMPIDGRDDAPANAHDTLTAEIPSQNQIREFLMDVESAPHSGVNEHLLNNKEGAAAAAPAVDQAVAPATDQAAASAEVQSTRGDGRANRHAVAHYNRDGTLRAYLAEERTQREADGRRQTAMGRALAKGKESWEPENWEHSFIITVKKAMKERPVEAEVVIRVELQQMVDKSVWRPVHAKKLAHEQRRRIIRSSMFLKDKYSSTGAFEKFKARLVAGGNMQDKSLYEDKVDLSSPTAATTSVFAVAAIAAHEGRKARVIDVGGAFLLADIKSTGILVHVRLSKIMAGILIKIDSSYIEFVEDDGTVVVELEKALYGCIEAAALWYKNIVLTLETFGYVQNPYDSCVFNKTNEVGVQSTVVLHVDDMLVTCVDDGIINELEACLRVAYPEITVRDGEVIGYLGMTFDFCVQGEVKVTMEGCVSDILNTCGVSSVKTTPASECLFDVREDSPASTEARREWFHSFVAKMLYLSKRVRPECLTTVAFLAKRVLCCTADDEAKLERLLGYLLGTRERGLVLRIGDNMTVSGYIDAAYGVHANGKSHTGCAIVLGEAALMYAKSGGQNIVTKSSTEAELVAVTDSAAQAIYMRNFVMAQGYEVGPCVIYQDNMSCMALIKRGRPGSERSRHINIRHFWVTDRVEDKEIVVRHLSTKKMFANVLTKPLQGSQFRSERNELTNWE